jgi:hypothetical protein
MSSITEVDLVAIFFLLVLGCVPVAVRLLSAFDAYQVQRRATRQSAAQTLFLYETPAEARS